MAGKVSVLYQFEVTKLRMNFIVCVVRGVIKLINEEKRLNNSRALVLVPKVDAFERIRTDDVRAGFVRRAVPLQIPRHGGLAPLRSVHGRGQGEVLSLETYVVQTTWKPQQLDRIFYNCSSNCLPFW